jgi:hypothetical protein
MKNQMMVHFNSVVGDGDLIQSGSLEHHMKQGQILSLAGDPRGCRISCFSGVLWLTQENDPDDHILNHDTEFKVTLPGLIVIEAITDSTIHILPEQRGNQIDDYLHRDLGSVNHPHRGAFDLLQDLSKSTLIISGKGVAL